MMRVAQRRVTRYLWRLFVRSWTGGVLGVLVALAPLPEEWYPRVLALQTPIGILILLCALGKALYDTLFYDRYQP